MKKIGVLLCTLGLCACSTIAEPRSWHFMQSVGGIAVDQPYLHASGWLLPVQADVSGLKTVTVKPTRVNSALACTDVAATVKDRNIYLVVSTGLLNRDHSPICPPAELGQLPSDTYTVFYGSPGGKTEMLRQVRVGSQPEKS